MCSTSLLTCITKIISDFRVFLIFNIFIFKLFFTIIKLFTLSYEFSCLLVNNFIFFFLKLMIFTECPLKASQNFFIQSIPLHTPCLFSTYLNDDSVDIVKPDRIHSLTYVADDLSGLFLQQSTFSIKYSRSA